MPLALSRVTTGPRPRPREMIKRVLLFPPLIALLLALVPLPRPDFLEALLTAAAAPLAPVAMIAVGLKLRLTPPRPVRGLATGLVVKLLLLPCAAWVLRAGARHATARDQGRGARNRDADDGHRGRDDDRGRHRQRARRGVRRLGRRDLARHGARMVGDPAVTGGTRFRNERREIADGMSDEPVPAPPMFSELHETSAEVETVGFTRRELLQGSLMGAAAIGTLGAPALANAQAPVAKNTLSHYHVSANDKTIHWGLLQQEVGAGGRDQLRRFRDHRDGHPPFL